MSNGAYIIPHELWVVKVLPFVGEQDAASLARALCTCRAFASSSQLVWKHTCFKIWPKWASIASDPSNYNWRRSFELFQLREAEKDTIPDIKAIKVTQIRITPRHRTILAEWLCEVAHDWGLDNVIVFKAVSYLDNYLSHHQVPVLARFQLLGLACLRVAMEDFPRLITLDGSDKLLDPSRFSYISDDTYTIEEVEEATQEVSISIPEPLKYAPNSKMFLRSFWYRLVTSGETTHDDMHIYTLASFLLQLALLDLSCSGHSASELAAAGISLSLKFFGKDEWPACLEKFCCYELQEIKPLRATLLRNQAHLDAIQLREIWRGKYAQHHYPENARHWEKNLDMFGNRCEVLLRSITTTTSSSTENEDGEHGMQVD